MLAFNVAGFVLLYALMRLQGVFPQNPQGFAGVPPDLAFNRAVSFVTNTNWQSHAGETTMSHLVQMVGLSVQNFVSAATGIGELMARLRAALRHGDYAAAGDVKLQAGPLVVDTAAHALTRDGIPVKLTPKEFDLMALLMRSAGRVLTHRQIQTSVWGPAHTEDVPHLRVLIGQLRHKLGLDDLIQTEPGIGYRLRGDYTDRSKS